MVSVLRNNMSAMFSKLHEFGKNAVGSIWSAMTNKVDAISKRVFANIEASQCMQAAGRAAQKVGDKALDLGIRAAAKTAMVAYRPTAKIQQHQKTLEGIVGNEDLGKAVHAAVPHLTEKLLPYLGDQSKIAKLFKSDRKLCEKMAEAKLLEIVVEIAKKTQSMALVTDAEGGAHDHFLMTTLAKLLTLSADHLGRPKFNQEQFEKETINLGKEFMGKVQKFVGKHIDKALLSKEKDKGAAELNEAQTLAVELLKGLGAAVGDEGQPVSVEECVKGVVKRFMQDGITKLLFNANEHLCAFKDRLGQGDLAKMPLDDLIKDICKSGAKDAAETLIDSVVKPGERSESAKAAINNRKSVIQDVLENLFTLAFKWIGTFLGLIDKKGKLFPEHSWISVVKKPFEILRRHWADIRGAGEERSLEKRRERLQESFENIIEESIESYVGDSLAGYLAKMYANISGDRADGDQPGKLEDEEQPGAA